MLLVGDYSPRTERILPRQIRSGKLLFNNVLNDAWRCKSENPDLQP